MKRFKVLLVAIMLSAMIGYILFQSCLWRLCDGFSVDKIKGQMPASSEQSTMCYPKAILNQDFFYLGKGSQCYVFESRDKEHVIKFFRHNRYRLPRFTQKLILPRFLADIQSGRLAQKKDKLNRFILSCQIAQHQLQEESGLVFTQLKRDPNTSFKIVIYDKLKRPYSIDLADHEFLIQKKGELLYSHFSRLIQANKRTQAQHSLEKLTRHIVRRAEKGIADSDAGIHKNLGFYQNNPIFLDIGQFSYSSDIDPKQELLRTTERLRKWLAARDPLLHAFLVDLINNYQAPT